MEAMDTILSPAFPVNTEMILAGGITSPRNGEEFLANVVVERLTCPDVVTVPHPNASRKQNIFASEGCTTIPAPGKLLPTLEWQNYQIADFSKLRLRVCSMYDEKDKWISKKKQWSLPNNSKPVEKWKQFFEQNEPRLSIIFSMNHIMLECALEALIKCLDDVPPGETIDRVYGRWIFAIMASLKLPLKPDVHSSLREIARICSHIRSKLQPDDEDTPKKTDPLNLFICLIARYFDQNDLAD